MHVSVYFNHLSKSDFIDDFLTTAIKALLL